MSTDPIRWDSGDLDGASIVRPRGELDRTTYRRFTDDLVKYAVEQPRVMIVVIDELHVASEPLLSAFSAAEMRVDHWPAVPIMLVAADQRRRKALADSAISRFVPVFATVTAAISAADTPPWRRRACVDIVPVADCAHHARRFVARTCRDWRIPQLRDTAEIVATELVENACRHTDHGDCRLRLELWPRSLTVAVYDADPHPAVLREPAPGMRRTHGLHIIAALATAWGCQPRWPTGKVVWAAVPTVTSDRVGVGR